MVKWVFLLLISGWIQTRPILISNTNPERHILTKPFKYWGLLQSITPQELHRDHEMFAWMCAFETQPISQCTGKYVLSYGVYLTLSKVLGPHTTEIFIMFKDFFHALWSIFAIAVGILYMQSMSWQLEIIIVQLFGRWQLPSVCFFPLSPNYVDLLRHGS